MIINNAPTNQAVLSNVGEIGEFRIRNSAKAFSILSSGLYANKIRAIVRELSCNAVDSHTAAGKMDTPFDVHLPTTLEPWFAIRDYGTGLSHDQVTSIYTTYFESTKTDSNAFIGALGLGSKSPFSYTDNFTVTAIKDGKKGIYSAFINEAGVPSIAQMMIEDSDEPSGVEVKFSVNDRWDFGKFRDEARSVYTYFKLRPVVTSDGEFEFRDIEYLTRDIIPGVHEIDNGRYDGTKAIMGNIAYPVQVPNVETNLGGLSKLLNCGLEMHFDIGELDFQASREGLSYIPSTIESIKRKLEAVNAKLAEFVATEADALANLWDRALFLEDKRQSPLWASAVDKYVVDTKFPLMKSDQHYGASMKPFHLKVDDLAKRFNINLRGFSKHRSYATVSTLGANNAYDNDKKDKDGNYITWTEWQISLTKTVKFVVNDLAVGAVERAKYHFRNNENKDVYQQFVYVLEPFDKKKPINAKAFFRAIKNPPASHIMNASDLDAKERAASTGTRAKNVTIMKMEERGTGGYYRSQDIVWRDGGKAADFSDTETYYYVPMSGYNVESGIFKNDAKGVAKMMRECGIPGMTFTVYGVRKGDIEFIKSKSNWKSAEDHIRELLATLDDDSLKSLAMGSIDRSSLVQYKRDIADNITNPDSPYLKAVHTVKNSTRLECNEYYLTQLGRTFDITIDMEKIKSDIVSESTAVTARYPLIRNMSYLINDTDVAEYINAIDLLKGVN